MSTVTAHNSLVIRLREHNDMSDMLVVSAFEGEHLLECVVCNNDPVSIGEAVSELHEEFKKDQEISENLF